MMNLEKTLCICYNAIRQKEVNSNANTNENPRVAARGFSCLFILDGKTKPSGLSPLIFTIKPFAKKVGYNLCHDRRYKRS
jgi:hypothetical protein